MSKYVLEALLIYLETLNKDNKLDQSVAVQIMGTSDMLCDKTKWERKEVYISWNKGMSREERNIEESHGNHIHWTFSTKFTPD